MRTTPLLLTVACVLSIVTASVEAAQDVGFQPLEIFSFKNGTGLLNVTDINGDGRDDIIFANNHVSRLEILIRREATADDKTLPELEERFEDRGMIVDQALKFLHVTDINSDGRPDLVTFGATLGLCLYYQQEDGSFGDPERIFVKDPSEITTLQYGDLNGNGRIDLLLCRGNQAELLLNAEKRPFQEKRILPFSDTTCNYCEISDINADGIADLIFFFKTARNPVRIHYGLADGRFGIEQPIDLPPFNFATLTPASDQPPQLAVVLRNRMAFRLYGFEENAQPQLMETQEIVPSRIGLQGTLKKSDPAWIAADFDQDGFDDLLVAAPELSQMHLYHGGPNGLSHEPQTIDTLSSVDRLSRLVNGDILVISKKEKIAALHSAEALEHFPTILSAPGEVLAGCGVATEEACWLVCRNEDKKLVLARIGPDGKPDEYALDLKNDPSDLLVFELPDHATGLLFFMPYATSKMFICAGEILTEVTSESFRALAQPFNPSNIRFDTTGAALTVVQGAIARRFEWEDGRYEATRQFNPENPRGELIASCSYQLLDGSAGSMFYDRNASELVHFDAEGSEPAKIHIPGADQTIFDLVQLRNPERDCIVLLDRTGLNMILGNGTRLEPATQAEYLSMAEDPALAAAQPVLLGEPMRPMLALIDQANRAIELIAVDAESGELKKEVSFEVFLISDFVSGRGYGSGSEPHDLHSGDLNGDGIGDLVILCQDKLLIYLGE